MSTEGHCAPHNGLVAGPKQIIPCGTKHKSLSVGPTSQGLLMVSIAIPVGGFSLSQTSHKLLSGISGASPLTNAMSTCAITSDFGGQPGNAASTLITSDNGLTLLSKWGTDSLGIIPSGLTVEHELMYASVVNSSLVCKFPRPGIPPNSAHEP